MCLTRFIQDQGQTDLIAQYAAALGDNAVSRYALFLAELPVAASPHERRDALFRAQEFGLDVTLVALGTAEMCMDRAFKVRSRYYLIYSGQKYNPTFVDPSETSGSISACFI